LQIRVASATKSDLAVDSAAWHGLDRPREHPGVPENDARVFFFFFCGGGGGGSGHFGGLEPHHRCSFVAVDCVVACIFGCAASDHGACSAAHAQPHRAGL